MRNHKTWAVLALALVVLIGGASILYGKLSGEMLPPDQMAASTEDAEPEKVAAPDFTVYDGTGTEVRLSDYVGKPIVLNFWASWCGPCQSEMPEFDAAYEELGEDIHFLMVNMTDGSRETVSWIWDAEPELLCVTWKNTWAYLCRVWRRMRLCAMP